MRYCGPLWVGVMLFIGGIIAGAFPGCAARPPGEEETTLRVALPSFGAEVLDPSMDGQAGLQYHGPMFDFLVGATPEGKSSAQLGALERWESSPDAKTYTITLRRGMRWHDGVEVTPADIEFSLAHYARETAACAACATLERVLERVEVVDRYTVRLHLKKPDVVFMNNLGPVEGDMPLLPKHYWEAVGAESFANSPLGSGPWKFVERSLGQFIEYEANRDYWNPERVPGFDRLRLIQVADGADRVAMLRAGEVDMAMLRPAGEAFSMEVLQENVEPLKLEGFTLQGPRYITATVLRFFMSYDPAFLTSRLEFRKALILAMDLPTILEAVYPAGVATLATGSAMFSPVSDGYDPGLPSYPYNPEAAQALLQDAGYQGETVYLFSIAAYGLTEMLQLNGLIADEWRQIGVDVRIIPSDYPHVKARYHASPQQFQDVAPAPLFHGVDYQTQPDILGLIQRYMTTTGGVIAYHDPERGDRIYAELSALADPGARDRRLRELNRDLYEEHWAIPIVWRHEVYGVSPGVEGWQPTDGTSSDLRLETLRPTR